MLPTMGVEDRRRQHAWLRALGPDDLPEVIELADAVYRATGYEEISLSSLSTADYPGILGLLQPWRYPRGSLPFDLVAGATIVYLIVSPWLWPALYGHADPLRQWIDWLAR